MTGSLLGSRAALRVMRQQPQHPHPAYHIFNLGFSGWGAKVSWPEARFSCPLCMPMRCCGTVAEAAVAMHYCFG